MTTRKRLELLKRRVHDMNELWQPPTAREVLTQLVEFADIFEMQQGAIERLAILLKEAHSVALNPMGPLVGSILLHHPVGDDIDNLLRELGIETDARNQ